MRCLPVFLLGILSFFTPIQHAFGCTVIDGLLDFNCDQELRVAVLGDSFVAGVGDSVNRVNPGYLGRLNKAFPDITFLNHGDSGAMAREILRKVSKTLYGSPESQLYISLTTADIVILDAGRNDRWLFKEPSETYGKLVRTCSTIEREVQRIKGIAPLCIISVLMLPNRGSQGPWVADLNDLIVAGNTLSRPSDLRFDQVSKRLLGSDQIHPTAEGYKALAEVLKTYLRRKLPRKLKLLRPDSDGDTIPDIIDEEVSFGAIPVPPR
jgi:lysophospholipase L1-like esterase